MKLKNIFILTISLLFLFGTTTLAANKYISLTLTYDYQNHNYNAEEVFVSVDNVKLTNLSMPPIILNNYTLVPAREVFENLGATVEWKKDIEQVYITYNNTLIIIPIDSTKAYVNGQSQTMDTAAKIINNKTMIPLRFVSTALGFEIEWNDKTRIANIITNTETTTITTTETTTKYTVTEITTETTTYQEVQTTFVQNENIYYENDKLYIKNNGNIQLSDITEYDNYNDKNYTIEINRNLSNYINNVTFSPNSDKIKSCIVTVDTDKTTISFNENQIIAVNLIENNNYICIETVLPKEKYNKIIVLDAGHGGEMPGAIGNDLIEKDLTLKIALSAQEKFNNDNTIKCYMTRTTDVNPSFDDRTSLANEVGDMFISVHINSANSSDAHGTETYCQYANDLGNGLTSYRVAEEMLNQLLNKLGTTNRNVKAGDLKVLRDSKIPASLIEVGFISNADDAKLMSNSIDEIGQAIYDGVINLFDKYPAVR